MTRWSDATGGTGGADYAARFDALAAAGADVHGEASFVATLVAPGARVLDAGCGTGRVALRLAGLGYDVIGTDIDTSMLEVARSRGPALPWVEADLSTLDLRGDPPQQVGDSDSSGDVDGDGARFDVVLMAGNIVPLVAPGTEVRVVERVAAHLRPGGLLVAGFGLDRAHLPAVAARVPLSAYDEWCSDAGLHLVQRLATWAGDPYDGGAYAVSVHAASTR